MGATDSKLAFKKGVFRLFEERNIPSSANDYWEQFWILPESAEDVFLLVGSQDIRRVRDEARENLECLLEKTLAHLFRLVESPQFLSPQAPASQVLNCVRILTRLFPFIFESDELMDWEERYFWTPRSVVISSKRMAGSTPPAPSASTMARTNQDAITPIEASNDQATSSGGQKEEFLELEEKSVPSHGLRLIVALQNLLFTSGFTLPAALEPKSRVSFVIWETGIGSSKPIGTTKELDDNRAEILRLLLVLFSRSMYIAPAAITTTENRWIDAVVTSTDRQATLAILCSLINSALKYNPSGWGLPYNHVMFSDQRDLLVMLSLQVVVVLLDYQVIDRPTSVHRSSVRVDSAASQGVTSSSSSPSPTLQRSMSLEPGNKNQFRYYLSRLHREQDFQFLIDGIYRILSNPMTASSTYLPGSTKHVKYHHETLILCWKTLELNKRFRTYLLETNRVLDILVILLYFCMEYKQDPTHIGLLRMCAFMLQTLSKDKAFGRSLNKVFDGHASLPANIRIHNFHGTYGDYLICTVHHLIATTKRALRSLYPALISTLANVSPHLKNISSLASGRLMQLTTSFASPSFLLAEESNHGLLGSLLDTVCSILYYQASDNPHLIYAVVQYEPKIQTMATFTLQRGLSDIHSLRYHQEGNHPVPSKQTDPRPRRTSQQRQQATQPKAGDSPHRLSVRRESNSTLDPLSLSDTASDSCITSLDTHLDERNGNTTSSRIGVPVLTRPVSCDSIMASDGGGHDGDVEDEGGPSTMRSSRTERTPHVLSEKARGKLPEGHQAPSFTRESSSEVDRHEIEFTGSRKEHMSATGSPKPSRRSSNSTLGSGLGGKSRQEQETTAKDVGQNGFIPTTEWVAGWMKTLRFEPLLAMLRHVLLELEQIQAMNDQQVLEYIRTNIAPTMQQVLPESGRPPIYTRRFVWSELLVWFQGLMWSQIYIGGGGRLGRQGLGAWHETGVRLFSIRTLPTASAAVTVSDNVASVAAAAMRVAGSTFASSSSSASALLSSPATSRTSMSASRPERPRRSSTGLSNGSRSRS
ncbi:hypothetical protein BG005_008218 [Podila minutissima]|nr:hypothetical protein BG005_008218 [Podila minutissima]